jgi:site-specific recombinase XerD
MTVRQPQRKKPKTMDRKGFISYLEGKGLAKITQKEYVSNVNRFFGRVKKEDIQITKSDILKYLEYLKNKGLQNITRSNHLIALNHYFTFLYQNEQITSNPCLLLKIRGKNKKKLHKIYTPEELDTLFDNYYQLFVRGYDDSRHRHEGQRQYSALYRGRNALITSILFNQGANTSEIEKIETGDIDLIKATIKMRGGIRLKERTLPLKATQIGLFMHYLQNVRPQLTEYQTKESEKLFLPLPAISYKKTKNDMNRNVFTPLSAQIKSIDKQFINFTQIRASVITFWIKTQGLRKAQYLAGHSAISTTEKYVANNLENLIDDINKLHPF